MGILGVYTLAHVPGAPLIWTVAFLVPVVAAVLFVFGEAIWRFRDD